MKKDLAGAAILFVLINLTLFPYIWGGRSIADSMNTASLYSSGSGSQMLPNNDLPHFVDPGAPAWTLEPSLILDRRLMIDKHTAPLWNPYIAYGTPLAADMQSQPYSPFAWVAIALPGPEGYNIFVLMRIYVAGVFMFLFLRRFLDLIPALVGGAAFMYSGYFWLYLTMPELSVEATIPALLLACELLLRRPRPMTTAFFAAAFAANVLGGMPEATILAVTFAMCYFVWRLLGDASLRANLRPILVALASGTAISVALAAILLLPFAEFVPNSFNIHSDSFLGLASDPFSLRTAMTYVMPLVNGPPWNNIFSGYSGTDGDRGFFGTGIAILALFGTISSARAAYKREPQGPLPFAFFFLVAATLLGKRFGFAAVDWIGSLPIFRLVLLVKYEEALTACSVAVLAAIGMSKLLSRRFAPLDAGETLLFVLVAVSVFANRITPEYAALTDHRAFYIDALAVSLTVLAIFALVFTAVERFALPAVWAGAMLFGAVAAEMNVGYIVPMLYVVTSPGPQSASVFEHGAPYLSFVRSHVANERFYAEDSLLYPNWSASFSIQDPRALDALYSTRYLPFVSLFFSKHIAGDLDERFTGQEDTTFGSPAQRRFLTLSSIRYVAAAHPIGDDVPLLSTIMNAHQSLAGPKLREGTFAIAGDSEPGLFVDPPQPDLGATVAVPKEATSLLFSIGILPEAWRDPSCGDGVRFSVSLHAPRIAPVRFERYIDPKHRANDRRWLAQRIDVRAFRGRNVRLAIGTDLGPSGADCYDWAVFGDMRFDRQVHRYSPLANVYHDASGVYVYRFSKPLPRLAAFSTYNYVPDDDAARRRIADPAFDPERELVVEGAGPHSALASGPVDAPNVAGTFTSYEASDVEGVIDVARPSIVMLNDTWFPGWQGLVDGSPSPILHVDSLFRGIEIPAGRHRVSFRYVPRSFAIGRILAILGLLALAGLCIYELVAWRRARRSEILGS